MDDDKALTVADLIRVLQKLPANALLWRYSVANSDSLTAKNFNEAGPLFIQYAGHTYSPDFGPTTPPETRLCFPYDTGETGDALDFSEGDA